MEYLRPRMEADFYIFFNIVELFSNIMGKCEMDEFDKWIPQLTDTFIEYSLRSTVKSGFYHLLTTVFKKCRSSVSTLVDL